MTEGLTRWETTRLTNHFILLDFLADHAVYRSGRPLRYDETWNCEHDVLAKGLCDDLLEPLMRDKRFGPISIAGALWPSVFNRRKDHPGTDPSGGRHRWTRGEATVDIALYRLVGMKKEDVI